MRAAPSTIRVVSEGLASRIPASAEVPCGAPIARSSNPVTSALSSSTATVAASRPDPTTCVETRRRGRGVQVIGASVDVGVAEGGGIGVRVGDETGVTVGVGPAPVPVPGSVVGGVFFLQAKSAPAMSAVAAKTVNERERVCIDESLEKSVTVTLKNDVAAYA